MSILYKMRIESEVKKMLEHCIGSNGIVSPTVIITLEWVLSIRNDEDCSFEFNLDDKINIQLT